MPKNEVDERKTGENALPKHEPGELIGVEYFKKPALEWEDDEKAAIRDLCRLTQNRDMPARREEVIRVWEARLFDRGKQHLLPLRNGGWKIPGAGTGYGTQDQVRSMFEINIYGAFQEIVTSVLTREVPVPLFESANPEDDKGITASENAEKCKQRIVTGGRFLSKQAEMARFLYTDGRAFYHTAYMLDAAQFGRGPDPEHEVPEDEEKVSEEEKSEAEHADDDTEQGGAGAGGQDGEAEPEDSADDDDVERKAGEAAEGDSEDEGEGEDEETPEDQGKPKGQTVTTILGALETKITPIKANCLAEVGSVQWSREVGVSAVKATFPEIAEEITPQGGGPGGDDIDRLARVNVLLGVQDNFQTSDTAEYDVTVQKSWFRSYELIGIKDTEIRNRVMAKIKKGLYVTFAGETFCEGRDESMDDYLTLVFAFPGDGTHRRALGTGMIPVQKIFNNLAELANDYLTRGIPMKWMDNEMFNLEALKDQSNVPGDTRGFDREQGVTMDQVIWVEPTIQFPPQLVDLLDKLMSGWAQLLTGAYDALTGGGDAAPSDTMGGLMIQRDQAIGRIGVPWRHIKEGIGNAIRQAVQCLARNSDEAIVITGSEAATIEMSSLRGDFVAVVDVDENIPMTWTEKQNRVAEILEGAATNPFYQKLLGDVDNLELVYQASGLKDLVISELASRDKQLGEIEMMLKTGPTPNPAFLDLEKQIQQLTTQLAPIQQQAKADADQGLQPDPAHVQQGTQLNAQLEALKAQIGTMPQQVSSEPVDPDIDDNDVEAATTLKYLRGPKGRALKNGEQQEQESYENIKLHYTEHVAAAKQKAAQAPPKAGKPPSVSIALKDLPPAEAAQAATMAGIKADPKDFAQAEAAEAVAKHPAAISVNPAQPTGSQ
jgi:hypothetical protein